MNTQFHLEYLKQLLSSRKNKLAVTIMEYERVLAEKEKIESECRSIQLTITIAEADSTFDTPTLNLQIENNRRRIGSLKDHPGKFSPTKAIRRLIEDNPNGTWTARDFASHVIELDAKGLIAHSYATLKNVGFAIANTLTNASYIEVVPKSDPKRYRKR